jgi:glycosyltransferase involved in cell wall biosynthesis
MKIGIDAKWYFSGPISGRVIIENVLKELFLLRNDIEWHVFLDSKNKNDRFPLSGENVIAHYGWAGLNFISNVFLLPKQARHLKLDAVFFQTFSAGGNSFKSIAFIHDVLFKDYPEFFTWKEMLYFKPLRWTIRKADRIITTTDYVKKELQKFGYTKKDQSIDLAPLGVTEKFKPAELHREDFLKKIKARHGLPENYLLVVGRLNARKNLEAVIRSLPLLTDKKICLVIVGEENWKTPNLRELLHNEELKSRIKFTGFATDEELSAIYAMAKIFCFPSFAEGFGLPPLEAMASGVPVVVSNTTSMPEVCSDAALYFDPNNPQQIADQINRLLDNKSLYDQKRTEGLEWSKKFTWKRTAQGILNSILSAIADKK